MAITRKDKKALLDKMRKQQDKKQGRRDSTEWRPPKVQENEEVKFRLVVLPPLMEGDICLNKDNKKVECKSDWDIWYYQHGHHYVNKNRYQCPRIHNGDDCPMCSMGFDLMRDVDDKDARRAIAKEWLSSENHAVNVYFLNHPDNPEELRGQVRWWNMPVKIYNQGVTCIKRDDDGGDEDDPQPYGLFFDPDDAYTILVKIIHKGGWNNYDESRFLTKRKAIASTEEEIDEILNNRIDIPQRFDEPDLAKLEEILETKIASTSSSGDHDGGFNESVGGTTNSNDDDDDYDDDDDEPIKESKSNNKSKAKNDDDDDDDDDEVSKKKTNKKSKVRDDEDDEDDESVSKKKSNKPKDDDDDDDEVDEEMKKLLDELES